MGPPLAGPRSTGILFSRKAVMSPEETKYEHIISIGNLKYSRTYTNGYLSTTATFLADSLYIDSCLNLSTTATFVCLPRWPLCVAKGTAHIIVSINRTCCSFLDSSLV